MQTRDNLEENSNNNAVHNQENTVRLYCSEKFCLRYDLGVSDDEEEMKMLKDFLDGLGSYCLNTKNQRLLKLMKEKKELKVSEVLKAISFDGRIPRYEPGDDFENFHNFVTKYMLENGWMYDFLLIIFEVPEVAMLRLSIFKYILANWNWIASIYSFSILIETAESYGKVSLKNSAIEEDGIKREFVRRVLKREIAELEQDLENRVARIAKRGERNDFFKQFENYI